jgi:hypothetical protein
LDFFGQIASILPKLRNRFALIGLVVAVAGFVATRIVAPEYVHAQIAAGTIGVLFLVFGQVFHHIASFPEAERTRLITRLFIVFVLLVLALVALTGYFLQGKNASSARVNTKYLATLVGREAFTEALPKPLTWLGFDDVQIGDDSAARRIAAIRINLEPDPKLAQKLKFGDDIQIFAMIELYSTEKEARDRSGASMAEIAREYRLELEQMSPDSFCVSGGGATTAGSWTCAGSRGYAYAETTLSPGINAYRGVATGVISALLNYTDKMTALATDR